MRLAFFVEGPKAGVLTQKLRIGGKKINCLLDTLGLMSSMRIEA
jgi:hypothetical protein